MQQVTTKAIHMISYDHSEWYHDTAYDLILSICISFDQARFYARFVVKLFIQKPFSFKR